MRILYFGDGDWAVKSLKRLLGNGHEVLAVVVRSKPSDTSLSEFAKKNGIAVVQPKAVNSLQFVDWVRSQGPELNISMSYDQILGRDIIDTAPLGFINCHAGKLPDYRGRNVINWSIINNEKEIGLTIHYVDETIDTGDIILQQSLPIDWEDCYATVLTKVEDAFPELLSSAVELIDEKKVIPKSQSKKEGTYFCRRIYGDEWIDWKDTSLNIYNKIRAITRPGPGAKTLVDSRILTIWKASYDISWPKYIATPGEVIGLIKDRGVKVKTGDSTLILENVEFDNLNEGERLPCFKLGTRFGINLMDTVVQLRLQLNEVREKIDRLFVKNNR